MIYELDCVFFNVLGEAGWLVGWIPWQIFNKKKRKRENKALAILPWLFNLMGIPMNFEILSHCTLELIWSLAIMC
jgi:hypothetical protein